MSSELFGLLAKQSDRLAVSPSKVARVFVTHDDGYGRSSGSGAGRERSPVFFEARGHR